MPATFHIETFGCQMNKNDSELIRDSMLNNGFTETADEDKADICIFNTCSVREHAEKRALSRISSAGNSKKRGRRIIVVAGCMAQRIGNDLIKNGMADIITGPYQSPRLGEIIKNRLDSDGTTSYLSQAADSFCSRLGTHTAQAESGWHSFVTITHGCENYCSYCIVPYVRGKLISFPSDDILAHITALANTGTREITLLGQNVNQYGMDSGDIPFYKLLERTAAVKNLIRVNFITSHPMDFSDEIIRVIRDNGNISRSIHLPLQSGSDRILEAMNRNYTASFYFGIIDKINRLLDDHAVSTDLIVGYPGETEEDYYFTLKAVETLRFDEAFMYSYSPREGTPASTIRETLSRTEKIERLERLIALQRQISLEKLTKRINRQESVIAERFSKKSPGDVSGKTSLNHPVVFRGDISDIGRETLVLIREVRGATLIGDRLG